MRCVGIREVGVRSVCQSQVSVSDAYTLTIVKATLPQLCMVLRHLHLLTLERLDALLLHQQKRLLRS